MEEIFDLKEGKVVINPNKLAVPIFKDIYERDKSKDKEKAFKELSYIYFLVDFKSPYDSYPDNIKEETIKRDIMKNSKWVPDELIVEAIKKYEEFQETPILRLIKSSKLSCDKLSDYFKNVDFTDTDDTGKLIYTAKDVVANLSSVGKVAESLDKLEELSKKQLKKDTKIRGGGIVGAYEQ